MYRSFQSSLYLQFSSWQHRGSAVAGERFSTESCRYHQSGALWETLPLSGIEIKLSGQNIFQFSVVDFPDGGGVSISPCRWFRGPVEDSWFWPPGRVSISKAVKDGVTPDTNWSQYRVHILGKACYEALLLLPNILPLKAEQEVLL